MVIIDAIHGGNKHCPTSTADLFSREYFLRLGEFIRSLDQDGAGEHQLGATNAATTTTGVSAGTTTRVPKGNALAFERNGEEDVDTEKRFGGKSGRSTAKVDHHNSRTTAASPSKGPLEGEFQPPATNTVDVTGDQEWYTAEDSFLAMGNGLVRDTAAAAGTASGTAVVAPGTLTSIRSVDELASKGGAGPRCAGVL